MNDVIKADEQLSLSLGNWKVLLYADVKSAEASLHFFRDHFQAFISNDSNLNNIDSWFFVTNPAGLEAPDRLTWWPACRNGIWEGFSKSTGFFYNQVHQTSISKQTKVRRSSEPFQIFWSDLNNVDPGDPLFSSRDQKNHQVIALITNDPDEIFHFQIFSGTLYFANLWHIERGGMCIHSSAVARKKNSGFLFLGPSEAGKSTVAQLSTAIGYPALGDDLNFIINDGKGSYSLVASPSAVISKVGYSSLRPSLMGIFTLVQDDHEELIPLRPSQVARVLFREFYKETPHGRKFPDKLISLAFHICGDIARRVPGFELHFQKKPDFWKLIDEQFPG